MNEKDKIPSTIRELMGLGFSQTLDTISEYSQGADLYFRQIRPNTYIIVNHYGKKYNHLFQGFDCWISTYKSEKQIGKMPAIKTEAVVLSIEMERDRELILGYLS